MAYNKFPLGKTGGNGKAGELVGKCALWFANRMGFKLRRSRTI